MKKSRTRKPSPLDNLIVSTAQSFAHQHTVTINSRRRVLQFEGSEVDRAIVALSAALLNRRRHRREIDAQLTGLRIVVEKR